MLYKIKKLVKQYDGRKVLDIESLNIKKGSVYGLLGPNGAGKTTLLEILAFILKADEGEFYFNNNPVQYKNSDLLKFRKKVVLVQQHPILFTTSVYRNIEFPLKIRKVPKPKRDKTVKELLEMVDMSSFGSAAGNTLSGGETQRAAIAQALACFPDVILLDEPTSSVDIENRAGIENIIRKINREKGITVLFTSHDMLQSSRISDEIIYVNNGRICGSIHENIFSGKAVKNGNEVFVKVYDNILIPLDTERKGQVRISVDPLRIDIKRESAEKKSGMFQARGNIVQLADADDKIRITVDIDISLSILMNKTLFLKSGLSIGNEVTVECPCESIQIL